MEKILKKAMKTLIYLLVFAGLAIEAMANNTTPVVFADVGGSVCVPTMDQIGQHVTVGIANAYWGVAVAVDSKCPGDSPAAYTDYSTTYSGHPGGWALTGGSQTLLNGTNGSVLQLTASVTSGPIADGNGSPVWHIAVAVAWTAQTNLADCWTNISFTVKNNDSICHSYYIDNFSFFMNGGSTASGRACPGQTITVSKTIPCDEIGGSYPASLKVLTSLNNVSAASVALDGQGPVISQTKTGGISFDGDNTGAVGTGSPASGNDGSDLNGGVPPNVISPTTGTTATNSPGTGVASNPGSLSNILWSASSADTAGIITAIKDSGKVLYDATVKLGVQEHTDMAALLAASAGGGTNIGLAQDSTLQQMQATNVANNAAWAAWFQNNGNNLSNSNLIVGNLFLSNSAAANANGIDAAINASSATNHRDSMAILAALTNGAAGTDSDETYAMPGSGTNATAAMAAANSGMAEPVAAMQANITDLQNVTALPETMGSGSIFHFQFAGRSVNVDPVENFPAAVSMCQLVIKFLVSMAYIWSVGQMYVSCVKIYAASQTGGVPNMEVFGGAEALTFGAFGGGNFIGFLVACIIPSVFLAIFVIGVTLVCAVPLWSLVVGFAALGSALATVVGSGGGGGGGAGSGAGSAGVYLLFSFFPVKLIVDLAISRGILQISMAKAMIICSSAARYLFGK